MITINWTKNGTEGSREFRSQVLADRFAAGLVRTGHTIIEAAPVAEVEQTGRVGNGLAVHWIVGNAAHCGASYRSRTMGGRLPVRVTGEVIDCERCQH
jgi:hypothetical protein